MALLVAIAAPAASGADPRIAWQRLVYRSASAFTRFTGAIEVTRAPDSLLAELRTELSPLLLSPRRALVQTWFEEPSGSVLRRITRTWQPRPDEKIYRFTPSGVARTRLEPRPGEADLPTSRWSQVRESFIPFRARELGCELVSDPAALLYRATQVQTPDLAARVRACVFDGRTLYRIFVERGELRTLSVAYRVTSAAGERRSPDQSRSRHFVIRAAPIAGEMEPYDTPVEVFIGEDSGLPLRARLAAGGFGTTVEVDLVEVAESASAPASGRASPQLDR